MAARYVPNVYCYEQIPIPRQSENPMNINYFCICDTTFDQKIVSTSVIKVSLKNINKLDLMSKNLKLMAQYRGIQANCEYAEGFI